MAPITPPVGIDPKRTENFLLTQPDVIDASVFLVQGRLMAHVTTLDESSYTPIELQRMCAVELGLHQTPRDVVVACVRHRAHAA